MNRIFLTLAWFAVLFVAATMLIGLSMGDLRSDPSDQTLAWARVHRLSGVAAALVVVFVNSILVTYFIGTTRWCKEVCETYHLDVDFIRRSNALKRKTFPWAVLSMLTVLGIVALGGAADPATGRPNTETWATWHLLGALAGLFFIGWSALVAWNNLRANQLVIHEILAEVRRMRVERGLEV